MLDALPRLGRTDVERGRNLVLVELIYATGMRVSELVSLPVSACRGDPALLLIRGKGGKEHEQDAPARGRRWRRGCGCAITRPPSALGRLVAGPGQPLAVSAASARAT